MHTYSTPENLRGAICSTAFIFKRHGLVHVRLLHCVHVWLQYGYTLAYAQIRQHAQMHKAVTVLIEAKKLFLAEGNQSIGLFAHAQLLIPSPKMQTDSLHYEEKFYFFLIRVISQCFP